MQRLGACEQAPVVVARVEWVNRPYRTPIPPASLRDRWHLEVELCADQPVRGAAMLLTDGTLHHTRGWADRPSTTVIYRVDLFPYDEGNDVQVSINTGIRVAATSPVLKRQPQESLRPLVQTGEVVSTGAVIDLIYFADLGWTAQVALVSMGDTRSDRTRWRVRQPLTAPAPYDFLMTGRRSGVLNLRH